MGGPAGPPTVYHNNITSVSRQHHIFNKSTQHLNIYQQYHITHQTNISTFHNRVTSISHLYHISITSMVKTYHNTFTNISHHISIYHANNSQQYHVDITSVYHQYLKHYRDVPREAQLIAYYLREPLGSSTYRILPLRASPGRNYRSHFPNIAFYIFLYLKTHFNFSFRKWSNSC